LRSRRSVCRSQDPKNWPNGRCARGKPELATGNGDCSRTAEQTEQALRAAVRHGLRHAIERFGLSRGNTDPASAEWGVLLKVAITRHSVQSTPWTHWMTGIVLRYLHSKELCREINEGLNVFEQWNGTTDFVFFARRGEMVSNQPEDHEISMLALHRFKTAWSISTR
jgi:Tn3 transposase DDE domain